MEDMQLALTAARVDQKNFGIWLRSWQVGQTLNALVTGQRPSGEIVLRVGGQQITATADIPVQQGSNLLLEVKQLRPVPVLTIVNAQVQAGSQREGSSGTLQLLSLATPEAVSRPQAQAVSAPLVQNLQVGQTLNALVTAQRPGGEITLRVGSQQLTASADVPVQQGSTLLLEVTQLKPVPVLRIINTQVQAVALREGATGTLQLLPPGGSELASRPLAQVVNTLRTVELGTLLPPPGVESVLRLLRLVASPVQLTSSAGVQSAVRNSGTLLEPHLLQASVDKSFVPPPGDMKAATLRVLAQVNAAIEQVSAGKLPAASVEVLLDIKRELEGSLASITLNQLNSQPTEQAGARSWIFDIPFQLAGTVRNLRIHIERDAQGEHSEGAADEDAEAVWRVGLDFSLPQLGPLTIAAKLQGVALFVEIAAENPASRAVLEAGVSSLASALESRGLELKSLQWRAAREQPTLQSAAERDGAVDLKA